MINANTHQRLLVIYAATLIGTLAMSWWIATTLLTASLENRLDDQLESSAQILAQGGIPYSEELLGRLAGLLQAEIILISPDSQVVRATASFRPGIHQLVRAAWADSPGKTQSISVLADDVPYRVALSPLETGRDNRFAAVAVAARLDDVRGAATRTGWWLAAVALLSVLLLGWVGHRIGRRLTVPVQQLAGMAGQIAAGDRSVRAGPDQPDELVSLASALDTMTEKLGVYEEEITAQSRLATLGEMSARIAHEIRNPLTAIKMQIQLLAEERGNEGDRRITRLADEIDRLDLVVSAALAVGRTQPLTAMPQSLNELVIYVAKLVTPQLEHRRIAMETVLGSLPDIQLDGDKVKQVLLNLVTNSIKALPQGGIIRITSSISPDETGVVLEFEDSGSGIDEDTRAALFKDPVSADRGPLRLGLVLSRELIALHGGTMKVDSSPDLHGARVSIRFPMQ